VAINPTTLHDLELPPAPLPDYLWWLAIGAGIVLLAGVIGYWRKLQHPVARALRQLDHLPDTPPNPTQLAAIMQTAGLRPPQSLDHARFAPTPCSAETFAALKREARILLEQAR
jgi:hypothetical protein